MQRPGGLPSRAQSGPLGLEGMQRGVGKGSLLLLPTELPRPHAHLSRACFCSLNDLREVFRHILG